MILDIEYWLLDVGFLGEAVLPRSPRPSFITYGEEGWERSM